jgi:glyoxalase family protein
MRLEGVHHVTAITGDAPLNVDFYTRVLGLRMVKKTVNQDDPTVYHLFYGDEQGSPGHDLTFFEYPGARRDRVGQGMVHTVVFRVGSRESLGFWAARLGEEGIAVQRGDDALRFDDPEGLTLELRVEGVPDGPLVAVSDVPEEHALAGFAGVRAFSADPSRSAPLLERVLGFEPTGDGRWETRGVARGGWIQYEQPPLDPGIQGAGTVHHVAWSAGLEEISEWQRIVTAAGARATPVIDRFWFQSVYFREPSGVLFEIATRGPGFTVDEPLETLGEKLVLPPFLEPQRERIEAAVTPLPPPVRAAR